MPSGDNQEFVNEMLELKVTARECLDIEKETRNQSCNEKGHGVGYKQITGSIYGRILCPKKEQFPSLYIVFIPNLLNYFQHQLFGDVLPSKNTW